MKQPRLIDINKKWYSSAFRPSHGRWLLLHYKYQRKGSPWDIIERYETGKLIGGYDDIVWNEYRSEGVIEWAYIDDLKPRNL